jgi:hypothetical protein
MSNPVSTRGRRVAAGFVVGALLAVGAAAGRTGSPRSLGPPRPAVVGQSRQPSASSGPENEDPEAHEHGLWMEHVRLLRSEPLLQRLPYRDRELGVQLSGATATGRPVLLVVYRGSIRVAREDLRSVLSLLGDRGAEYAVRYRPLGRS